MWSSQCYFFGTSYPQDEESHWLPLNLLQLDLPLHVILVSNCGNFLNPYWLDFDVSLCVRSGSRSSHEGAAVLLPGNKTAAPSWPGPSKQGSQVSILSWIWSEISCRRMSQIMLMVQWEGGSVILRAVKLPWIFPGAPMKVNGAPWNIQDNLTALSTACLFLALSLQCLNRVLQCCQCYRIVRHQVSTGYDCVHNEARQGLPEQEITDAECISMG